MPFSPPGEMPMNSSAVLIVLAVNWPPHAPGPGHAGVLDLAQLLETDLSSPIRPDRLEDGHDGRVALPSHDTRVDRAVVEDEPGQVEPRHRHGRTGQGLVTADKADETIEQVAAGDELDRVGDHLAATSDAFMPSVPMLTPSDTAIVLNSIGVPPAARMPSLTFTARSRWL